MELFSMVAALTGVVGVVIAKIITTARMSLLQRTISTVEQEKHKVLLNLKAAAGQKKVFDADKATLERKKRKLEGKRSRLQKELGEFGFEEERRALQREQVRGKISRS
jgi:hypothetical protein